MSMWPYSWTYIYRSMATLDYPSLISLVVSVDVKHHVYLHSTCEPVWPSGKALGW